MSRFESAFEKESSWWKTYGPVVLAQEVDLDELLEKFLRRAKRKSSEVSERRIDFVKALKKISGKNQLTVHELVPVFRQLLPEFLKGRFELVDFRIVLLNDISSGFVFDPNANEARQALLKDPLFKQKLAMKQFELVEDEFSFEDDGSDPSDIPQAMIDAQMERELRNSTIEQFIGEYVGKLFIPESLYE